MYALRHKDTKDFARVEFCGNAYTISFDEADTVFYVVSEYMTAFETSTSYGSAISNSFAYPINNYVDELEVVELIPNSNWN